MHSVKDGTGALTLTRSKAVFANQILISFLLNIEFNCTYNVVDIH